MHIKNTHTERWRHPRSKKFFALSTLRVRFVGSFVVLAVIVSSIAPLLPFFTPAAHAIMAQPTNQNECISMGGKWDYVTGGGNNPFVCNIPLVNLMTPAEEATSMTYYHDLSMCVQDQGGTGMWGDIRNLQASQDGQTDPLLWYDNNNASYTVYPQGTLQSCADITKKALQLWGWGSDYKSFLSGSGYTYINNTTAPYWHGSADGSARWAAFSPQILSKVYGGSFSGTPDGMSSAAQYAYYLDIFTNQQGDQACQAQDLGLYNDMTNTTYRGYVDRSQTFSSPQDQAISGLFPSNASGEVKFQKISIINSSNALEDHGFAYETHNGCSQAADMVNRTAPGWVKWINTHPNSGVTAPITKVGDSGNPSKSSCGIDNVGWLVCPVLGFMGTISDQLFSFLASNFLSIDTQTVSTSSGTYTAWAAMRNIANVVFVIAFVIIIFSQLTGTGVTNYGIKKMLPRIIVAAILVNISFYICQIAVDLSNILGYGLKQMFNGIQTLATPDSVLKGGDATGNGLGIAAIVTVAIAGGITLLLAITFPVLLAVALSLLVIVFILLARKALIILLIIVAPLAFVAYLLPNTEQWYKKWEKMFITLLMVFPVISVVFGASSLAAYIIKGTAAAGDNMTPLIAIGVATIPLIMVPTLLKGSLLAAGTIGATLKGHGDRHSKRVGENIGRSKLGQLNTYRKTEAEKRRALIGAGQYSGSNRNPLNWGRNLSSRTNRAFNSSRLSGGFGDRTASMGVALADKMNREEVEDQSKLVANLDADKLKIIANDQKSSATKKAAALQRLVTIGEPVDYEALVDKYGHDTSERNSIIRKTLAKSLGESGQQFLKALDLDQISTGSMSKSFKKTVGDNVDSGVLSERKMASDSNGNLKYAYAAASDTGKRRMEATAASLKGNETLRGEIKHNAATIDQFAKQHAERSPESPVTPPSTSPPTPPPAAPPTS